jgi:Histidine-specific methyltransferase, SAM-dependent
VRFRERFPNLVTRPVAADFCSDFTLPEWIPLPNRVAFFPGSTIGNLNSEEVAAFLRRVRAQVGPGGKAIIGADLRKSLVTGQNPASSTAAARALLRLLARPRDSWMTIEVSYEPAEVAPKAA